MKEFSDFPWDESLFVLNSLYFFFISTLIIDTMHVVFLPVYEFTFHLSIHIDLI